MRRSVYSLHIYREIPSSLNAELFNAKTTDYVDNVANFGEYLWLKHGKLANRGQFSLMKTKLITSFWRYCNFYKMLLPKNTVKSYILNFGL